MYPMVGYEMSKNKDGTKTYTWVVKKSYQQLRCKHKHRDCINFSEKYQGEKRCFRLIIMF
jgi:hypothetical protein